MQGVDVAMIRWNDKPVYRKHTKFMINFISDFINGETERYFFNLDYNAYVIEHFPYMEIEDSRLGDRFANTIDRIYER